MATTKKIEIFRHSGEIMAPDDQFYEDNLESDPYGWMEEDCDQEQEERDFDPNSYLAEMYRLESEAEAQAAIEADRLEHERHLRLMETDPEYAAQYLLEAETADFIISAVNEAISEGEDDGEDIRF